MVSKPKCNEVNKRSEGENPLTLDVVSPSEGQSSLVILLLWELRQYARVSQGEALKREEEAKGQNFS